MFIQGHHGSTAVSQKCTLVLFITLVDFLFIDSSENVIGHILYAFAQQCTVFLLSC